MSERRRSTTVDEEPWTDNPRVLLENWTSVVPNKKQSRNAMGNSLARLTLVVTILLSLAFGSLLPIGVGLLGLYLSRNIITAKPSTKTPVKVAAHVRKRKSASPKQAQPSTPRAHIPSWSDMFGTSMDGNTSGAMGAYVGMANTGGDSTISYFPPESPVVSEGTTSRNLVPLGDVEAYQGGAPVLRTPFPRAQSEETTTAGPWQASAPYQAGYPTEFGPAPAPLSGAPVDAYQPAEGPVAFGMFQSDGGYTSTPLHPAVPHSTAGQNFPTETYRPRHFAPAGEPLPTSNHCQAPNTDNPLGNPEVYQNRVARPPLCTVEDPRSNSTQFVDSLFESTAQTGASYNFFPFPVQDVVEARDNYQDFVIKSGLTHYKDKYSNPEDAGRYNFTDFEGGELGF